MFTLFKENKETYYDATKLWFLYDAIKHPQLMTTGNTLQVGDIAGNTARFTGACGHLDTMVSKFPESQKMKRNVLFVEGYCARKIGHTKVPNDLVRINTGKSEIYTGYYADFFSLSKSDQEKVPYERKLVGKTTKGRVKNANNPTGMLVKAIKAMKAKLKAQTITIYAMKAKFDI